MLVLSRQRDESVVVLDPATGKELGRVSVVEVRGDKVRLGFDFPKEYGVHRREVFQEIQREQREAAEAQAAQQVGGK